MNEISLLTQFEIQVAIPTLVGLATIALAWIKQRLNLQNASTAATLADTANNAIQIATANFAGKVSAGLADGSLTTATAVNNLKGYLATAVADSYTRLSPNTETLTTILLGKVAVVAGVPVVAAALAAATPVVTRQAGVPGLVPVSMAGRS